MQKPQAEAVEPPPGGSGGSQSFLVCAHKALFSAVEHEQCNAPTEGNQSPGLIIRVFSTRSVTLLLRQKPEQLYTRLVAHLTDVNHCRVQFSD